MKTKQLLSSAAVLAVLVSGAGFTTQTANAEATSNQTVTQKSASDSIEIGSTYFKHYNVLSLELKTPISVNDSYDDLALDREGSDENQMNAVIENGYYIGFDFKLDNLVKKYPTVADREALYASLYIR